MTTVNWTLLSGRADPPRRRLYDPVIGRFISVDPIMDLTDPQQWNAYSYGNDSPITQSDPEGLEPRPWHDPNYNPETCANSTAQECHPAGKPKYPVPYDPGLGRNDPAAQYHYGQYDDDRDGYISRPEMTKYNLDYDGRREQGCNADGWKDVAVCAVSAIVIIGFTVAVIGGAIACANVGIVACATAAGSATLESAAPGTAAAAGAGAIGLGAKGLAANAGRRTFDLHPRVAGQLDDPRLGSLRGKLTPDDLQELAHNPSASYLLDGKTGNINVVQEIDGVILRITMPRDAFKIISVGRIRPNQLSNGLESGRFVPIGPGG